MIIEYNPIAIRCGGCEPEDLLLTLEGLRFDIQGVLPSGSTGEVPTLRD